MSQTAANTKQTNTGNVNQLTDQVMAFDLLISAKAGVNMVSRALTEASTPDVRIMLNKHLGQAISYAEQVGAYITDKGWVTPSDMKNQLAVDAKKAQETLELLK
jgi:similar to spore coat protein